MSAAGQGGRFRRYVSRVGWIGATLGGLVAVILFYLVTVEAPDLISTGAPTPAVSAWGGPVRDSGPRGW